MSMRPGARRRDYTSDPDNPEKKNSPKFVDPHSPWQVMIEEARIREHLSIRAVAATSKISAGTLFNWIRSVSGYPSKKHYTPSVNNRLARALKLKPAELAEAYNQSASMTDAPGSEAPRAPRPAPGTSGTPSGQIDRLLAVLSQSGRDHFTLDDIRAAAQLVR